VSGYRPPTFVDACSYLVRRLVRTAFNMAANSVRPSGQDYPTAAEATEFATVKITKGPVGDFGTQAITTYDDPTAHSTKVVEDIERGYTFTASIQFFRHALPAPDSAGLAPFGLGALDKASRLESVLGSSSMMELMERMGLGLQGSSEPIDVAALIDDARWEDRGAVTLDFVIVNRETFLIESIASADVTIKVAEPGATQPTTEILEVTS
jgi:hypothetical protein